MSLERIEDAKAILSEHCEHYVILAVLPDYPEEVQMHHSSPFTCDGLLKEAERLRKEYSELDYEYEVEWDDDDNDEF